MSFAAELATAAEVLRQLNARTDSGPKASWTADDLDHAVGSFAAEDHTDGICPACNLRVLANELGCVCLHADKLGKTCVGSGLPFYTAVVVA